MSSFQQCLVCAGGILVQLFDFVLPWGITFGGVIVGVFGLPILVRAFVKLVKHG